MKPILADVQALGRWANGPNDLADPQLLDMEQWLTAVIRRAFKPEYRHPNLVRAAAPAYQAFPELAPLRKVLTTVLGRELNPSQFLPRPPVPASPTATPPPTASPNQPA